MRKVKIIKGVVTDAALALIGEFVEFSMVILQLSLEKKKKWKYGGSNPRPQLC